jgi:hypothetical protein
MSYGTNAARRLAGGGETPRGLLALGVLIGFSLLAGGHVSAQTRPHQHPPQHPPGEEQQTPMPDHATMAMGNSGPLEIGDSREGSGTAWQPDATPMYAVHLQRGAWTLMVHENAFLQFIDEGGRRGDEQFGSINWAMGMARRHVADGPLTLRAMMSLEPLTVGRCGYPNLLASGEFCRGEPLHDRQHPHDLFMEVAASYKHALSPSLAYDVYAAAAGEPALGPVAYPHRASAMANPLAPVAHHWLDSTHVSFGVLTAGLYQRRWKIEGSVFNGREPDDDRYDIDLAALDSYSGRLWLMPNDEWAVQVSAGHLRDAEQHDAGGEREDVDRVTASVTYQRRLESGADTVATTVAWGLNSESEAATNAVLAEGSLTLRERHSVFARAEVAQKTADDLAVPHAAEERFTVAKVEGGYVRHFSAWRSLVPGIGASVSVSAVPASLAAEYGHRASLGFSVFVNVRPAAMKGMGHSQ